LFAFHNNIFLALVINMRNIPNPVRLSLAFFTIFFGVLLGAAQAADVQLSQFDDAPDPAIRGGNFTYTLSIENNATDIAYGVVLTLPLPATTVFVSATGTGCSHDGLVPGTVTCNLGNLLGTMAGGLPEAVTVTIRTTAATGNTVNATATVSSTTPDTDLTNNSLTQNTTINDGADLSIAKVASPASVVAGGLVDWTISSRNLGPNGATSITITDSLPGTLTYVSASGTGWTCGHTGANPGGVVTCTRPSPNAVGVLPDVVLRTQVTGAVTGTVTNSVTIAAAAPADPITANNTVNADVTVTLGTDLAITKIVSSPVIGGNNATFTLRPRNNGPFSASTVVVTDTLPADFTYSSSSGAGWSCSHNGVNPGGVVTCTRASYAVGAANNISIVATSPTVLTSTAYTNIASISSATPEANVANNTTSLTFNVVPDGRDLSIAKTKTPNPVAQNAQITSHITVTNNGPSIAPAATVRVTDTLNLLNEAYGYPQPTPTLFFSGGGWNCTPAGNVVTCDYANALSVGGSASVDIYTTALGIGTITNTACAVYTGAAPGDNVSGNDCTTRSTTSTEEPLSPDLSIAKLATTANADTTLDATEQTITYTITVTNNGPGNATGMVMTDTIPGYVTGLPGSTGIAVGISTASTATFNCTTGSTVTCTQTGGTLPVGQTIVFTIGVSRPLLSGTLNNTANITSTTLGDPNPANNQATATVTVDANADVEVVSKSVLPVTIFAGTNATYTISVRNNGPSTADSVTLVDDLCNGGGSTDCNYTLISATASGSGGSCLHDAGAHTVTCTWGPLSQFARGRVESVTVILSPNWQALPPNPRQFVNTATISTTTPEKYDGTNWGNNSKSATLTINPATLDVLVNKTDAAPAGPDPLGFAPAPVGNDNLISYLIRITNNGPSLASGVMFTDTMTPPAGRRITFMRVSDTPYGGDSATTTCTNTGVTSAPGVALSTTCTLGPNVAASASVNRYLIFQVMDAPAASSDTYTDTVIVTPNETDTNPANNSVSQTTTVRVRADISTAKVPSSGTVQMKQPFLWTISVTNNGNGNSQITTLTDTLPAGMQYITPAIAATLPAPYNAPPYSSGAAWINNNTSPGSGTCSVAGSAITCNFGLLENTKVVTLTVPVRMITYPAGGTTQNCATAATSEVDPVPSNNSQCTSVTVQKSSIAGTVYRDLNNDGAMSGSGEIGISNVQLRLQGTDAYNSPVDVTTTTNGSGNYIFDNLSPSNVAGYTITEPTQPANFFDGKDTPGTGCGTGSCGTAGAIGTDIISGIQLDANSTAVSYLFGELPGNTINGYVYSDANNNGIREGGETGIIGITITLTGTDYGTDGVLGGGDDVAITPRTKTTDASGYYEFTGLRAGNYQIAETQPPAPTYLDGKDTAGTVGGAACGSCSTAVKNRISNIIMPTFGITAADMNFGELAPASLAGSVYNDTDNSGTRDPGEAGIPGITVTLTGTNDLGAPVSVVAITDVNGNYNFGNLRPGAYTITETQPAGFVDGKDTAGSLGGTTSLIPPKNFISAITLGAGQNGTGYIFGEAGTGITGSVYVDSNNNGIRNVGEVGILNVTITLTGTDTAGNPVTRTTTTAADGSFAFYGLPATGTSGSYTLTETQPSAWADGLDAAGTAGGTVGNDIISAIHLNGTTVASGYTFGERGGSLSGFVYNDVNNNGVKNPGEQGIQGVNITLTGTDINGNPISLTTITAADGSYIFNDLPRPNGAGYTITETQPSGYGEGIDTIGSLVGSTHPAQNTFFIPQVSFPAGANGTAYNFGERVGAYSQVSGRVWFDANHDRVDNEGSSAGRPGWIVELIKRDNPLDNTGYLLIAQATTDATGNYAFTDVLPNNAGVPTDRYEIRFRHPPNSSVFGVPVSTLPGVDLSYGTIRNILLNAGDNALNQSLPLDPGGVIYSSITRLPIAGATIAISGPVGFDPASHLVGGAGNITQVTGTDGVYQYILLSGAPAGQYTLTVTSPAGYLPFPSALIPSCTNALTVNATPAPLLIQTSNSAPGVGTPLHAPTSCPAASGGVGAGAGTTQYYLLFNLIPGTSAAVVNNHIPIDPILGGAIIATKTTPLVNVKRGDLVPYTITMTNTLAAILTNIDVRDIIPPGFKYRTGSGTLNGVRTEPLIAGRELTWRNLTFVAGEKKTFLMILVVGSGVSEGEYTNQAYAANNIVNTAVSNIATATVRVIPDPTFDCPDIIGKVFDDKNANGYQDEGEPGIANVRLATVRGLIITTDADGRFHIPCPEIPNENRGSNFILKLDDRTLPSGYRVTTENPLVARLTRGKMTKMNFGATVHRVIRIDVNAAAFEKEGTKLLGEWQQKIQALEKTLHERPTVVRIAYRMGAESKSLVDKRIKTIRDMLQALWKKGKDCPPLVFEEEIVEVR